jgi:hypothetical protein
MTSNVFVLWVERGKIASSPSLNSEAAAVAWLRDHDLNTAKQDSDILFDSAIQAVYIQVHGVLTECKAQ